MNKRQAVRKIITPEYNKMDSNNAIVQFLISKRKELEKKFPSGEYTVIRNVTDKMAGDIIRAAALKHGEKWKLADKDSRITIFGLLVADEFAKDLDISAENLASKAKEEYDRKELTGDEKRAEPMYLDVKRGKEGQPTVVKRETSGVPVNLPDGRTVTISDVDLYKDILAGKKVIKSLTRPSEGSIEDLQIRGIQTVLKNTVAPNIKVDGIFGSGSKAAVIKFQKNKGLSQDGAVGRQTISKMIKSRKDLDVPITGKSIDPALEKELLSQDVIKESRTRITEDRLRKLIRESLIKLM